MIASSWCVGCSDGSHSVAQEIHRDVHDAVFLQLAAPDRFGCNSKGKTCDGSNLRAT